MDRFFTNLATRTANAVGQPITFMLALLAIFVWLATGPLFRFSDTWQLVMNTGSGLVTFVVVFLIQNAQNRDAAAMQAKLDELIRAVDRAREEFIGIEHLPDREIAEIRDNLEGEVGREQGKDATADDTVDCLLRRYR